MSATPSPAAAVKPRGKPSDEGRFIWLSSLAVERILNALGQTQSAFGIAVYVSLARLSGKAKGNPEVRATVAQIAGMARLGYRKVWDILNALEADAKVIAIQRGARAPGETMQPPSTYVLLSMGGRLHGKQSARLHGTQSADCIRRTPSHAENPIHQPQEADDGNIKETVWGTASALLTQAQAAGTVSKNQKISWNGECER